MLLDTADDYVDPDPDPILGIAAGEGTDAVSGVGVMNLAAAFQPSGTQSIKINGQKAQLANYLAPSGGAFGDWATASGAFEGLVFTDKYDRGFVMETAPRIGNTATFADLETRERYVTGDSAAFS